MQLHHCPGHSLLPLRSLPHQSQLTSAPSAWRPLSRWQPHHAGKCYLHRSQRSLWTCGMAGGPLWGGLVVRFDLCTGDQGLCQCSVFQFDLGCSYLTVSCTHSSMHVNKRPYYECFQGPCRGIQCLQAGALEMLELLQAHLGMAA